MSIQQTSFKRLLITGVLAFICFNLSHSQGIVRGKITDDYGVGYPFVNITLMSEGFQGNTTDLEGDYSIEVPSGVQDTIEFTAAGVATIKLAVFLKDGEVLEYNGVLTGNVDLEEAIVISDGKVNKGSTAYLDSMVTKSGSLLNIIGSQQLKRTTVSTVDGAVSKLPGASTVGGFVAVRGLVDRYIKTTVNGAKLPSLDPLTNNTKLDIFPVGLIDNIVITKSMTPDLPGDWAGAYLSINTKDFPSKLTVNVSTSFGYNTNATGQEIVSSQGSDTDWLGFDNGFRDIPEGVPLIQSEYPRYVASPSLNEQFQYLGIGSQLASYGIDENTVIANGSIYHQVGLNQLGLLGPGDFGNDAAVSQAVSQYNDLYTNQSFYQGINSQLEDYSQRFNSSLGTITKTAPINFSQGLTLGNQIKFLGRDLGFLAGFRYSQRTQYDPESVNQRTIYSPSVTSAEIPDSLLANDVNYSQKVSRETHAWSGLLNLSYKLNKKNRISFLFMPNFRGQNRARQYAGFEESSSFPSGYDFFGEGKQYEERNQLLYQFKSQHYLESLDMNINMNLSYADGERNILDLTDFQYVRDQITNQFELDNTWAPDRRFRYLLEDFYDFKVHAGLPIFGKRTDERKLKSDLKFGFSYERAERENQQVLFQLRGVNTDDILDGFSNDIFSQDKFEFINQGGNFYYSNSSSDEHSYVGFKTIYGGYIQSDFEISHKLRAIGGVRVEDTDILVDIKKWYEEEIAIDSPNRQGQVGLIDQFNILPSLNLVYKLRNQQDSKINLRANYSRSLARPGFRELSLVAIFDYEIREIVAGNPDLQMTDINNFDFRVESYLRNGTNISLSGFYKNFKNHIELIRAEAEQFTWQNVEFSQVLGLEVEGKINITPALEARGNITFIDSETTVTFPVEETRSMFGQAPYIINGMLSYKADSIGLILTANYNVQGEKLAIVANSGVDVPDVFEQPRQMLNLKATKFFGDHWSCAFSVRNLLNVPVLRQYVFDDGRRVDFDRFTWGSTYGLNISYKL